MAVDEIAAALIDLLRQGRFDEAIERFYAEDALSIEPVEAPDYGVETRGKGNIRAKNARWEQNNQVHSIRVEGPFLGDGRFALRIAFDYTSLRSGRRLNLTEMALYSVANGRIVREDFYYTLAGV